MSAADRFQIVKSPAFAPGEDAITRSTVGPFIDTGTWIDPSPLRRRLYLSVDTVKALAEAAGIVQPVLDSGTVDRLRAEGALEYMRENLDGTLAAALRRLAAYLDDAGVGAGDPAADESADPVG